MIASEANNAGMFQEYDRKNYFTYRMTQNAWAIANDLTHEIDVLDGVRFAKVLKTVAHVCIDEDSQGKPVLQSWKIKNHDQYQSNKG